MESPAKKPLSSSFTSVNSSSSSSLALTEDSATNIFLYYFFQRNFNAQFNFNFINLRCYNFSQHHPISPSRHAILTFTATMLLNFLMLKYQGKNESPFETHPKTMFVAVASLILYSFSYDAKLRIVSSSAHNLYYVGAVQSSMALLGPLSLASLSSILFPQSLCPVLFVMPILFSLCEFPLWSKFKILWKWLRQLVIRIAILSEPNQQQGRGRKLLDSNHFSRLTEHAILEQYLHRLPV